MIIHTKDEKRNELKFPDEMLKGEMLEDVEVDLVKNLSKFENISGRR